MATPLTYAAVMDGPVWVILPTYDEAENLEAVVGGIRAALPEATILVVDDNSPDGTGQLAEELGCEVLHRPGKQGLGRAYTAGFAHALESGAEYVIEMDADLSHDPADLPRLLEPAREGADLVLGSRYAAGGGIENWGLERRVISRVGCGYARRLLGVDVRDLTGGFKCFRASTLRAIDATSATAQGYAFQVELTWRVLSLGLTRGRGPDPLPRAPARASRRCRRTSRWRRRGAFPRCASGAGAGARYWWTADLPIHWCMKADDLALVAGWPHTRATLRRWNTAPLRRIAPWALLSLLIALALLGATWLVAVNSVARPVAAPLSRASPAPRPTRTTTTSCAAT